MLQIFLLVNIFQISYTILLSLVKDMTTKRNVGVFEFAFFRSLVNMFMSAQVVRQYNVSFYESVPSNLRGIMFWRSLIGTLGFLSYTTAPMYIPIGVFQVIVNMTLFAVAIMAWAWLNEKISFVEVAAMFLAFYGIYLTQKKTQDETAAVTGSTSEYDNFTFGILMAPSCILMITLAKPMEVKAANEAAKGNEVA